MPILDRPTIRAITLAAIAPWEGSLIDSRREGLDADSISQNTEVDEGKTLFGLGTISPHVQKGMVNQKLDSLSV